MRDNDSWDEWLLYMMSAVEETAYDTIRLVNNIKEEIMRMKNILRNNYKFYSQELLNHLFKQPYTKIEVIRLFHKRMRLKNRPTE